MSKPRYDWWGYVKAIIRRYNPNDTGELTGVALRENEAVRAAVEQTERYPNGQERLAVIEMVFWKKTHTLEGAALMVPCSIRTAQEWHRQFIRLVARNFGLLD